MYDPAFAVDHEGPDTHSDVVLLRLANESGDDVAVSERFRRASGNTGNLLFESALTDHLTGCHVVRSLEALPRSVDTLVLTMSNILNDVCDMSAVTAAIECRRVERIALVGVGAQAYNWEDGISLLSGTDRLLRMAAERGAAIGVRGYFTAEFLDSIGIRNIEVIGCPSAFSIDDASPGIVPSPLPWSPRLAVHATPLGHFRDKVSALMAHGQRHSADYIIQSEQWLTSLIDEPDNLSHMEQVFFFCVPFMSHKILKRWLLERSRAFFNATNFITSMHDYDFVYGMRFHGNMAAILAGVPALNMVFDTRTRELCEYLNLPFMELVDLSPETTLDELYDQADFSLYRATLAVKRRRYIDFLERAGLRHRFALVEPSRDRSSQSATAASRVYAASLAGLMRDAAQTDYTGERLIREVQARIAGFRSEEKRRAVERGIFSTPE